MPLGLGGGGEKGHPP